MAGYMHDCKAAIMVDYDLVTASSSLAALTPASVALVVAWLTPASAHLAVPCKAMNMRTSMSTALWPSSEQQHSCTWHTTATQRTPMPQPVVIR